MARLHKVQPTVTVHADWWEPGEQACLRTFLSGYDRAILRASNEALKARTGDDAQTVGYGAALLMLLTCLESWSFSYDPEEGGGPIPITAETVKGLDERDFAFLVKEMTEHLSFWQRPAPAEETLPAAPPAEPPEPREAAAARKKANFPGSKATP